MVTAIITVGFIGIIVGASTHHAPHHRHHIHQPHVEVVHVAPPPVVRHHGKRVVVVKSKPAPKKGHNHRPARKHHKR